MAMGQQGGDPGLRGRGKELRPLTRKYKHFLCARQALCPAHETPELTKLLPQDACIPHSQDLEVAERASRSVFLLSLGVKMVGLTLHQEPAPGLRHVLSPLLPFSPPPPEDRLFLALT